MGMLGIFTNGNVLVGDPVGVGVGREVFTMYLIILRSARATTVEKIIKNKKAIRRWPQTHNTQSYQYLRRPDDESSVIGL